MRNVTIVGILIAGICIAASASFAAPKTKILSKKKIPAVVMIENKRQSDLTNLSVYEVGADEKVLSSIKKPVSSGKKIMLSLKGLKSCTISIAGTFADESDASGDVDVCTEKSIRLVD